MDPISITCSVIALVQFALSSSAALTTTIRSLQGHDKRTLALKRELIDLAAVLEQLRQTIDSNPGIDFDALKSPLHRCGNACTEYGELIGRFTKHSGAGAWGNVRDWVKQKYLQGDVTDFKDMLAGYKATMNIAIANINIRVAAITPQALEDYKTMMADAKEDLQQHLQEIEAKINALSRDEAGRGEESSTEWQAILQEKKCTQQGLEICAQLSAEIQRLEPTVQADPGSPPHANARVYIRNGLGATKASIQTMMDDLHSHEGMLARQIQDKASAEPMSEEMTKELQRLQATKDSLNQCMRVISDADSGTAEIERHNVFEDITLAGNSYSFTVSTVGDLVTARRINLTDRSYNVAGQIADESFQRAVEAFTKDGLQPAHDIQAAEPSKPAATKGEARVEFQSRHGRGVPLMRADQPSHSRS